MATKTTKPDDFANELANILHEYEKVVVADVAKCVDEAADIAVSELKSTSPRAKKRQKRGGKYPPVYAEGWRKRACEPTSTKRKAVVYNATSYRLTNLLEHGHKVVTRNGKNRGKTWAEPIQHIENAEQTAIRAYEDKLRRALEK